MTKKFKEFFERHTRPIKTAEDWVEALSVGLKFDPPQMIKADEAREIIKLLSANPRFTKFQDSNVFTYEDDGGKKQAVNIDDPDRTNYKKGHYSFIKTFM